MGRGWKWPEMNEVNKVEELIKDAVASLESSKECSRAKRHYKS